MIHSDPVTDNALLEATVARVSDSGIIVLSSGMQVRYMSGRAVELIKSLQQEADTAVPELMPTAIEDFCLDLFKALSRQAHGSREFSCELRRLAGHPERPILLRGFAVRRGHDIEQSHVVVILQERIGRC